MPIRGTTEILLIPACPVAHVRSPELFNQVFDWFGIDAVLAPVEVPPGHFPAFVRGAFQASNLRGMLLSNPHKTGILPLLDRRSEAAQAAGAANAVRRGTDGALEGDLFDGSGFVRGLHVAGIDPAATPALIVGAGGAAAAIASALLRQGCESVSLFDTAPGKARKLAQRLNRGTDARRARAVASADPAGYRLVVNATPLGLDAADPMPFDVDRLDDGAAVVDILMTNQPTPLLRAARAAGHVAQPGYEMLIQQMPDYLAFFGFHDAARAVGRDATPLRMALYPPELLP